MYRLSKCSFWSNSNRYDQWLIGWCDGWEVDGVARRHISSGRFDLWGMWWDGHWSLIRWETISFCSLPSPSPESFTTQFHLTFYCRVFFLGSFPKWQSLHRRLGPHPAFSPIRPMEAINFRRQQWEPYIALTLSRVLKLFLCKVKNYVGLFPS